MASILQNEDFVLQEAIMASTHHSDDKELQQAIIESILHTQIDTDHRKASMDSILQSQEEELQQAAIMASSFLTQDTQLQQATISSIFETNRIFNLPEEVEFEKQLAGLSIIEAGESSNSNASTFICTICYELKSNIEPFRIKGCNHSYCSDCVINYISSKIQENIASIPCPESNCQGVLEPEFCRWILPPEVYDRWGNVLCESLIFGYQRLYCPFKDCSELLSSDDGGEVVKESECPYCRRLFCAQCMIPWHSGLDCEEFQNLNEDERGREDIMVMELAKNSKWQRCPKCCFYIERADGCVYMRCRCGYKLCYICRDPMYDNHHCSKCNRTFRNQL